jgi:hypothetical protein
MTPRPNSIACKSLTTASAAAAADKLLKHKRRYCGAVGCTRIVKSQGLCQRHGAKPRKCRIDGCAKQAQGNFDGMCKSHFKLNKHEMTPLPVKSDKAVALEPPPAVGESVYDRIIPTSLSWNPVTCVGEVPLIAHLKEGFLAERPPAWHRNEERRARGLWPVHNPAMQLEGWESELVWTEILLLTGHPDSSFLHLARGWGRDKGFHMVLAQFICERNGDVERKTRERANAGKGGRQVIEQAQNDGDCIGADVWDDSVYGASDCTQNGGDYIGADVWDDAVYGDSDYNEALAADLLMVEDESSPLGGQHHHARNMSNLSSQSFNFHDDEGDFTDEFDVSSSAGGASASESNSQGSQDEEEDDTGGDNEADLLCLFVHNLCDDL